MTSRPVAAHPRTIERVPQLRRQCLCGCEHRATHVGLIANTVIVAGCELSIRRWLRDG